MSGKIGVIKNGFNILEDIHVIGINFIKVLLKINGLIYQGCLHRQDLVKLCELSLNFSDKTVITTFFSNKQYLNVKTEIQFFSV